MNERQTMTAIIIMIRRVEIVSDHNIVIAPNYPPINAEHRDNLPLIYLANSTRLTPTLGRFQVKRRHSRQLKGGKWRDLQTRAHLGQRPVLSQ